ncbi:DUF2200 domain-containing protein [Vagococcus vulneris]|uniref:DUF2200 domain-containing protein n=1 Tax=Vagococcus vulneris TaxID=1977869 RepID=A0A429ZX84_9ENTE|nr:DUF2200 domain-containing protein [Vagococcus vulneris]RST98448.1 hypothetical protein CBF37_08010 [Vagococcus vulneris]
MNKSEKVFSMSFNKLYPLYVKKVERKGKTKKEVDKIIQWLTGYNQIQLDKQLKKEVSVEAFFNECPQFNSQADLITGVICGYRVEEIENPLMQKIRYLDKLIDELAKGKAMEKILRK